MDWNLSRSFSSNRDRAEADQLVDNVFIRPDQTRISPRVQSLGPGESGPEDGSIASFKVLRGSQGPLFPLSVSV